MALTRISPGVYRNEKGQTVYSKDGKTATSTPGGVRPPGATTNTPGAKKNVTGNQLSQTEIGRAHV